MTDNRDLEAIKLMDTNCKIDYKQIHYWVRLGVILSPSGYHLIWRCHQCNLCVKERLEFIKQKVKSK